jgi:hypothetical protein
VPLKILVGYAPGGAADAVARAVGEGLRSSGYTVVVENKAGAGGRLAIESLLTLPADGGTVVIAPMSNLTGTWCPWPRRARTPLAPPTAPRAQEPRCTSSVSCWDVNRRWR